MKFDLVRPSCIVTTKLWANRLALSLMSHSAEEKTKGGIVEGWHLCLTNLSISASAADFRKSVKNDLIRNVIHWSEKRRVEELLRMKDENDMKTRKTTSWSDHWIWRCTRNQKESFLSDVIAFNFAEERARHHFRSVCFDLIDPARTEQSTCTIGFNLI